MSRHLTNRQKRLIKWWIQSQEYKGNFLTIDTTTQDLVNSDIELFERIEKINDYETLWQDITRYINDNLE